MKTLFLACFMSHPFRVSPCKVVFRQKSTQRSYMIKIRYYYKATSYGINVAKDREGSFCFWCVKSSIKWDHCRYWSTCCQSRVCAHCHSWIRKNSDQRASSGTFLGHMRTVVVSLWSTRFGEPSHCSILDVASPCDSWEKERYCWYRWNDAASTTRSHAPRVTHAISYHTSPWMQVSYYAPFTCTRSTRSAFHDHSLYGASIILLCVFFNA